MSLTYEQIKDIILSNLRDRGYSPNPSDVHSSATQIMELVKEELEAAAGESLSEAKRLAPTSSPLISPPVR